MVSPGEGLRLFRLALVVATAGAVIYGLVGLSTNELGPFVFVAILGGIVTSLALVAFNRRHPTAAGVPDPFARDAFGNEALNFAHVRVAGVGGAGLLIVVAFMAFQFALTKVALLAGFTGGIVIGLVLIAQRRRPGSLRPR